MIDPTGVKISTDDCSADLLIPESILQLCLSEPGTRSPDFTNL